MRKIMSLCIAFLYLLLFQTSVAYTGENMNQIGSESIFFTFPGFRQNEWRELSRESSQETGLLELFPVAESPINWRNLISIQYFKLPSYRPLQQFINQLRSETIKSYPGNRVTWNIIDQKEKSVLYEWILHEEHRNIPAQHEICRLFLGDKGYYRVGITKRYGQMGLKEKEAWIKALQEGISIVPNNHSLSTGISLPWISS